MLACPKYLFFFLIRIHFIARRKKSKTSKYSEVSGTQTLGFWVLRIYFQLTFYPLIFNGILQILKNP